MEIQMKQDNVVMAKKVLMNQHLQFRNSGCMSVWCLLCESNEREHLLMRIRRSERNFKTLLVLC